MNDFLKYRYWYYDHYYHDYKKLLDAPQYGNHTGKHGKARKLRAAARRKK